MAMIFSMLMTIAASIVALANASKCGIRVAAFMDKSQRKNNPFHDAENAIIIAKKEKEDAISNIVDKINREKDRLMESISKKFDRRKQLKTDMVQTTAGQLPHGPKSELKTLLQSRGGSNKKKRVLILMSDTGGGHRASAQALDQAMNEQFPGKIDVNIMDIWTEYAKPPFNTFIPGYRFMAKRPLLWRAFYWYGLFPPTKLLTEIWSWNACYKSFRNAIIEARPDMVVSVHPLCQYMPLYAIKELNDNRNSSQLKIPFVTVVTDLGGAHSTWFDRRSDVYFLPSEIIKKIAVRNGIKTDKIVMHGLPVRPAFWKPARPKEVLRKALGLTHKVKTVLLMGGGDGVGGLGQITNEIVSKLSKRNESTQLVVICGHNKQVQEKLTLRQWPENVRVIARGFCDNIDEFMAASDLLVTKAGPGTIAEAMIRGLPMVLSSFLPGQEAGNVPYVVDGGFGVYANNRPRKIAEDVSTMFQDEAKLKQMSSIAKAISRPGATKLIAKDIAEIALRKTDELPVLKRIELANKKKY